MVEKENVQMINDQMESVTLSHSGGVGTPEQYVIWVWKMIEHDEFWKKGVVQ